MTKPAKKKVAKKATSKKDITLKVNGSFADVIGVSVGKKDKSNANLNSTQ